ncbi:prepilin-type N-terminal cleavage/methylation domain-containing protein [Pseudoduganella sp. GCM10020061]|uniref:prepilin-type N-terminal cleavage/methylation domain-containing protein n=1 Tax=Pseudoduganella sp. GCM10020061 TaxID=3317345 RepID=UPI00363E133B
MSTKRRQLGVTLVELIVFVVIVSIAVAGILGVMSLTTAQSADPLRRKQALMIAESLMEEVQMADFTVCDPASPDANNATNAFECAIAENWGPEAGNSRPFDNVNDYVGGSGTPSTVFMAGQNIIDATGSAFNVTGYSATVTITPTTLGGIGGGGASADTAVLHIRVAVSYDGANSIVLDGYRTRHAPVI